MSGKGNTRSLIDKHVRAVIAELKSDLSESGLEELPMGDKWKFILLRRRFRGTSEVTSSRGRQVQFIESVGSEELNSRKKTSNSQCRSCLGNDPLGIDANVTPARRRDVTRLPTLSCVRR